MSSTLQNTQTDLEFKAKDPTPMVVAGIAAVAVVAVAAMWSSISAGDAVTIAIVATIVVVLGAPALLWARKAARLRLVVSGETIRLGNGKAFDLNKVMTLSERRIAAGGSSYTAYFAVFADSSEVRLFAAGTYKEQDRLLQVVAERANRPWERQ